MAFRDSNLGLLKPGAFFEAVAGSIEFLNVELVGDAVQESSSKRFVAKDLHPPAELQVAGGRIETVRCG